MTTPVRLQLSRRKGFNLQALSQATNSLPAVNVARPTKWGNPFPVPCFRREDDGTLTKADDAEGVVRFFVEMLLIGERNYPSGFEIIEELRNKNLACWCRPEAPCHADVLLKLANPVCEAIR